MAEKFVLDNALIVNDGRRFCGHVVIDGPIIAAVNEGRYEGDIADVRDMNGNLLIPGVIDTHVHFREPGLTHKADIYTESRAAAAGGVTSYFDMPNCKPMTVTAEALEEKNRIADKNSAVNRAFYIGANSQNIDVLRSTDYSRVPGVKVFLGQSTGNMQLSGNENLDAVFSLPQIISVHSEDQGIIDANMQRAREKYGDEIPVSCHPEIRSAEACLKCTTEAVERARRLGTHLHICHITTEEELQFLDASTPVEEKKITGEACVQHLWFTDEDYPRLGTRIKCNPAIKGRRHREALLHAVADGRIDVVSTDHAPHTLAEKEGGIKGASGIPLIQYSLQAMLDLSREGHFPLEKVVEVMCHNPTRLFGIEKRGYIRPGYYADLAIVDLNRPHTVTREDILSKCGWSPFEGHTFTSTVTATYVNGAAPGVNPMPLRFIR